MSGATAPSLDLGKNNSTAAEASENGRYDCREQFDDMFYQNPDEDRAEYRCNQWDCYCCGYRMRQNLIEEIDRITSERTDLSRLLTLTLDPAKAPSDHEDRHYYVTERWNALRTRLKREIGDFSYIWVREEQESGNPHLHVLVSRYLPQGLVSAAWSDLGGGEVVDIRKVNTRKAAHYVGKYLTKDALSDFPKGIRRYGSSADLDLDVRGSSSSASDDDQDWELLIEDDLTGIPRPVVKADFVREKEPEPPPAD